MTDMLARYEKAEAMLSHKLKNIVPTPYVGAHWIPGTETFWYKRGTEVILVDAESQTKRTAFDLALIAKAISEAIGAELPAEVFAALPFELSDGKYHVSLGEEARFQVDLDTYEVTTLPEIPKFSTVSPNGRWALFFRDYNLWVFDTTTSEERQLTFDGEEAYEYGGMTGNTGIHTMQANNDFELSPSVIWAADSTRFYTHRIDEREVAKTWLVRSAPFDGGRPELMEFRYSMPGEEHQATSAIFVFNAETGDVVQAKCRPIWTPFVNAIGYGWVWWSSDQSKLYWISTTRGDRTARLNTFDAATGEVAVALEESSDSQILFGPQQQDCNIKTLSTGEVIWWSQRTDWAHLYLYGTDGSVTPLTSGDWYVRSVVLVDEEARRVVFTGAGREPGSDPYLQELYSVSLDGGEITTITNDGLDHHVLKFPSGPNASDSGRYFVDNMSRWDVPNVAVVRDRTGAVVMELETCDPTALYAAGWTPPERAVVKAADGVTDIYCGVYKPHDFDPTKTYPVLDTIYPGPQISTSALRFPLAGGVNVAVHMAFSEPWSFAALGFVVVAIDQRGAAMRSKSFQDATRVNGGTVFVDDHVTAIKQLAETRPWMDLDKVGTYGISAGGYASTRLILEANDFYKVCVSGEGNHDDRINHAWWGEKFFGLVEDFDYEKHANVSVADRLKGKLLLMHGELDDNALYHHTIRLAKALIEANKDFDLMVMPNADHFMMVNRAYFMRRRYDYFVEHLMGEVPPKEFKLDEIPTTMGE
ncbi:MAG TPA: DPP IV N-terminal domain-containing protein [Mycobacteriales bacterium]|nr:DPP IV N-terminal domain-containing protein [Mycobacteriales bacterium]